MTGHGDGNRRSVSNRISDSARLTGVTVQAGEVHGGIHVYQPPLEVPVPRQLLPVPPHFTDRESDLASLRELSAHSTGLLVVTGAAGIGKTSLVTRWLRTCDPAAFPGGHFYADLRGHTLEDAASPSEILGRFLRALYPGPVPADLAEQTALWRSLTSGLRLVVMLDNVCTAAQARPLIPGSEHSLVVVTSRRRLSGLRIDGAVFHSLDVLPPHAAETLLTRTIGKDRVDDDPAAARRVVALCAGLPLAVCVASARLAARPRQPLRAMADALARPADRLAVLKVDGETAVRGALDDSYEALPAPAARIYRRLGHLPLPELDGRIAAVAGGHTLQEAEELLDVLVEANLLQDPGPDTYTFHDLVRLHARHRGTEDEANDAVRRVADWCLATATEAEKLITPAQFTLDRDYVHQPYLATPFTDESGALRWLDRQRVNLMTVLRTAEAYRWHSLVWQLVDAAWPLFLKLRYYDLWIEAHERGLAAARLAGHAAAERQMLNSGAIGLSAARRIDEAIAWYSVSQEAARLAGDRRDEGQALLGIGAAHFEAGRLTEAVPYLDRAIALWEETGYARGTGLARIVLGEIALAADEPAVAVRHFDHARTTLAAVPDPHDTARALAFLGRARADAGEYESGTAQLQEALRTFERSGSVHWQARTMEMLGQTAQAGEDMDLARDHYLRSLALCEPIDVEDARRLRERLAGLPAG